MSGRKKNPMYLPMRRTISRSDYEEWTGAGRGTTTADYEESDVEDEKQGFLARFISRFRSEPEPEYEEPDTYEDESVLMGVLDYEEPEYAPAPRGEFDPETGAIWGSQEDEDGFVRISMPAARTVRVPGEDPYVVARGGETESVWEKITPTPTVSRSRVSSKPGDTWEVMGPPQAFMESISGAVTAEDIKMLAEEADEDLGTVTVGEIASSLKDVEEAEVDSEAREYEARKAKSRVRMAVQVEDLEREADPTLAWTQPPKPGQYGSGVTALKAKLAELRGDSLPFENPRLTTRERRALPLKAFGLPSQRKYPMMTISPSGAPVWSKGHAAEAKARASEEYEDGRISGRQYKKIVNKANKVIAGFVDRRARALPNPSIESVMRDLPRRRGGRGR